MTRALATVATPDKDKEAAEKLAKGPGQGEEEKKSGGEEQGADHYGVDVIIRISR